MKKENFKFENLRVYQRAKELAKKVYIKAFGAVGEDSRALRLLLDLSQAHINEYGGSYKLPSDDEERCRERPSGSIGSLWG